MRERSIVDWRARGIFVERLESWWICPRRIPELQIGGRCLNRTHTSFHSANARMSKFSFYIIVEFHHTVWGAARCLSTPSLASWSAAALEIIIAKLSALEIIIAKHSALEIIIAKLSALEIMIAKLSALEIVIAKHSSRFLSKVAPTSNLGLAQAMLLCFVFRFSCFLYQSMLCSEDTF